MCRSGFCRKKTCINKKEFSKMKIFLRMVAAVVFHSGIVACLSGRQVSLPCTEPPLSTPYN